MTVQGSGEGKRAGLLEPSAGGVNDSAEDWTRPCEPGTGGVNSWAGKIQGL